MKREILFRGKQLNTGEWFFGNLFDKDNSGRTHIATTNRGCLNIDPETVGQFTGMTDKNGTKIFEGDILNEKYKINERLYYIVWDNDYFALRAESEYTSYQLDELLLSHCEVIGNIHDNKELLK